MKYKTNSKFNGWCGILSEEGTIYTKTKKELINIAKNRKSYIKDCYPITDFKNN